MTYTGANSNLRQIKHYFYYSELRTPISVGQRRFIDVTKIEPINLPASAPISTELLMKNPFPIRNNINVPLLLNKVEYNESIFHFKWLHERRHYIYPNQNREEFLLLYRGPTKLELSPVKHLITLEFNGGIRVPV